MSDEQIIKEQGIEIARLRESYDEQTELLITIQDGYVRKEKSEARLLKEVYEWKARAEAAEGMVAKAIEIANDYPDFVDLNELKQILTGEG